MDSLLKSAEQEQYAPTLTQQAAWFLAHTLLALATWFALMMLGYALNPARVSQWLILLLSMAVPLVVGLIVNLFRHDDVAGAVWLVGVIWLLIAALYVLDLPTGPNACLQCSATEKLARTFFSIPRPSGLIDDDGPFLGTWPVAALVGYSIGAKLGGRRPS